MHELIWNLAQAAPPAETVTIPWGSWISNAATALQPIVTFALTGIASYVVAAYVPPWLKALAGSSAQDRVNTILENAVASALAQVKDAAAGKELTIPVSMDVLRRAMQYAVDQAPTLIKSAAKDNVENLMKMVMARMQKAGVIPADFDVTAAKEAAQGFDFDKAIKGHLGG